MSEEGFDLKNMLAGIAKFASGKNSKKFDFAKSIFKATGVDQTMFQWILKQVIANPNLAKALYQIRSLVTKENADAFLQFSLSVLIPSSNDISILLGIVSIGVVHSQFPIEGHAYQECRKELKKLLIHEDQKIKDSATVILHMLGDSAVDSDSSNSAKNRLEDGGFDIIRAIEG